METEPQIGDLVQINLAVKIVDKFGKTSFTVEYLNTAFTIHSQSIVGVLEAAHQESKKKREDR